MGTGIAKQLEGGIIRPSRPSPDKMGGKSMQVNIYDAKTHFTELINSLDSEKEIIIAKRGTPVAKLVPYEQPKKRKIGIADGLYKVPATVEEFDKSNDEIARMFGL